MKRLGPTLARSHELVKRWRGWSPERAPKELSQVPPTTQVLALEAV